MKRLVIIAAVTLVAGYIAICAVVFVNQRKLIFPAPKDAATWGRAVANARVLDGPADAPFVVHFHGNGESVAGVAWLGKEWNRRGVGFAAVEYPGYGDQPGSPSETGIYDAAEAALQALAIPKERLVLVGQSLGSGPAVEMAARGWGSKLVLLTPFSAMADVAGNAVPWLPVRVLLKDRFDSASKAPRIELPVLIVHGTADEVVPYPLGKKLSLLFPHAQLMTVEGAHHNDIWSPPEVFERVAAFVKR